MGSISQIRQRFSIPRLKLAASEALYDTRSDIKLLQVDQLKLGMTGKGNKIGTYKSPKYAAMKFAQNPLAGYGNVDLIRLGVFSGDIFVDVRPDVLVIDSGDPKAAMLFQKYGDPLGLNMLSRIKLIPIVKPPFIQHLKGL